MFGRLKISGAMTAAELRAWARHCGNGRAAARAYAIANALDGLSRAEAARLAGMERQALRDALIADTDRIKTLCYQPWVQKVIS